MFPVGNNQPLEAFQEEDSGTPKILLEFKDLSQKAASEILEQKQDHPLEQPNEDLIAFVIEQVGKGANNPRAYAIAVLRDDRSYWEQQWEQSKHPRPEPEVIRPEPLSQIPFESAKPPPPVPCNDREAILARAASYLKMGKSPNMAQFARQKLENLIKQENNCQMS